MTKILHVLQIICNCDKSSKSVVDGKQQSQKVYRHYRQYATLARGLQVVMVFYKGW
jgi:hypothetical protein